MVTLTGFQQFIYQYMQIPASALPSNSQSIVTALAIAQSIVNPTICAVQSPLQGYAGPSLYDLAVYNLAGDNLINYAIDQSVEISGIAWLAGVATVTTAAPFSFATGDMISIYGAAPSGYNSPSTSNNQSGAVPITVTGADTFTYPLATNPGTYAGGGVASEIFFSSARKQFGINSFVGGTIASSADVSTSESLNVPEQLKELTLANLQQLKTPFGRRYLEIAGQYGQIWGLS
jgi:hypothetical protein